MNVGRKVINRPGRILAAIAVALLLADSSQADDKPGVPPAPPKLGHSLHGEAFDDGPRQAAYLMESTSNVDFRITTRSPEAQKFFNQGLGQIHGFWYYEAERSFRQAAALDPDCAIAYFGMALANVNNEKRAREFIAQAVKRKDQASDREKLYINALDDFYKANGGKKNKERYTGYTKSLEKLLYKYPDDVEARALLALSLWTNRSEGSAITSHLAIDALLDQVFRANPMHPAHHYRIHLWDHEHAENALASAALCGQSAPGIAHMWHMPGHIYSDVKRYGDACWQQEASTRVDHAYMMRDRVFPDQIHNYAHNSEWMIRNFNHVGRVRESIEVAKNMIEMPRHPKYNSLSKGSSHYGRQRLFELLNRYELWSEGIALTNTSYLDATDDEAEQLVRLRFLQRARFRSGDSTGGQEILTQIETRLITLTEQRDKAVEEAGTRALAAKKDEKAVEKARNDAKQPFSSRIGELETAISEGRGELAFLLGDNEAAVSELKKANLDQIALAYAQLRAGASADAEATARKSVDSHKNEVRPQACYIDILWTLGKRDEAKTQFDKLREMSTFIDLQSPVFTRLSPIAAALGFPDDWRVITPPAADVGVRPPLDSLGPLIWRPSPAPSWSLPDANGQTVTLEQFRGRPVVLIFFLGHGCLHCAEQIQAFAPKAKEFTEAGFALVAVSSDSQEDLKKSIEAFKPNDMPFTLVSNANRNIFKAYRAHDDFENQPLHAVFVLDGAGRIRWQDISFDPFMEVDFVLKEGKRQLAFEF